jgi:hypothetical protein
MVLGGFTMKAFEARAIVQPSGEIRVAGVPFSAGTEVEVVVSPKRQSGDEFRRNWAEACRQLRSLPAVANLSEQEIQAEVAEYRARR